MQHIDPFFKKTTHLSMKVLVILISKSQSQIYNSSLQIDNFPKMALFKMLFKKYNLLIKNSKRISMYQQKFLLSEFLITVPNLQYFSIKIITFQK